MSEPIRAVDRALDILLCFTRQTPRLTMTQISEQVGMNKSTVHRLLGTLEKKRFLQREPETGMYQLGIRLLQMSYLTLEHNDLRQHALPYMRNLCEQHRETVTLSVLDDADVIFLNVVESTQRVKLAASVGQRLPAFATAAGKSLLAYLPEERVRQALAGGMQKFTRNTIDSQPEFMKNLAAIRGQGFAVSEEEYEDGINAVGAPILDDSGYPLAAISVTGPAYRLLPGRIQTIAPSVLATVREIAQGFIP